MNINEFSLFKNLPEIAVKRLTKKAKKMEFLPDEFIVSKGSRIEHVYFISTGRVKEATYTRSGKEVVFNTLSEGDCFGIISPLSMGESKSDFVAGVITYAYAIRVKEFLDLMNLYPSISQSVLAEFARMNMTLLDKLYEFRAMDVAARTQAELLRHLSNNTNAASPTYVEFNNLPTHEEIANTIFTHREAVTKEISKLKKCGVIIKMTRNRLAANETMLRKMVGDFL